MILHWGHTACTCEWLSQIREVGVLLQCWRMSEYISAIAFPTCKKAWFIYNFSHTYHPALSHSQKKGILFGGLQGDTPILQIHTVTPNSLNTHATSLKPVKQEINDSPRPGPLWMWISGRMCDRRHWLPRVSDTSSERHWPLRWLLQGLQSCSTTWWAWEGGIYD